MKQVFVSWKWLKASAFASSSLKFVWYTKQLHFLPTEVWNGLKSEQFKPEPTQQQQTSSPGEDRSQRVHWSEFADKHSSHYPTHQKAVPAPGCFTCVVWEWRVRSTLLFTEQQNTKQIAKMLHLPLPFDGLVEFTLSLTTITLCHLGKQSEGEIEHTWKHQQGVHG